jgi:putative ABC transport system permease protein
MRTTHHRLARGFRWIRRLAPPSSRIVDDDAELTFSDACRAAAGRGRFALLRQGLAEYWDLVRCVIRLRLGRAPAGIRARTGATRPERPDATGGGSRMIDDLKHALKRLRARRSTTLIAVTTLSLAIGISVAMFTVVDALIFRPAPFKNPESFVWLTVGTADSESRSVNLAIPLIKALRAGRAFATVHAVTQEPAVFGQGEASESVAGARVTPGVFEDLGARPLLGRTFLAGEDRSATDDVVMVSERLWRSRFGAETSIIGRRIDMSGGSPIIIGVLPDAFRFPFFQTQIWRPLNLDQAGSRRTGYAFARLAADIPRTEAFRLASDAVRGLDPSQSKAQVGERPVGASLDPYSSGIVETLAAGVGLVFLLLCANVTILMLAGIGARRQEFAVCSALGASRSRLMRQTLIEQIAIGAMAAGVGLAIAAGLVSLTRSRLPADIIGRTLNLIDLDFRAGGATIAFALVAVIIAGVLPAIIGTGHRTTDSLRLTSRSSTPGRRARTVTSVMLVAEVALAVALTAAAGLQLRSFVNLLHENRGLEAEKLAVFTMSMPAAQFGDAATRFAYAEAVRASLAGVPGIEATTLSRGVPPNTGDLYFYDVTPDTPGATPVKLVMNAYDVAPEFFSVYGIRFLQGRGFESGDPDSVAVISRSLANSLWPGATATDRTMSFMNRTFRVIGVVSDIRNPLSDPREDQPELYWPLLAPRGEAGAVQGLAGSAVRLSVRCGPACPPLDAIRVRIKSVNAFANISAGKRIADDYAESLARPRAGTIVAIAFAAIALVGIAGGLFAVMSRLVLQRQREFGIRLALGARPVDLGRLVRRHALVLSALGVCAGTIVAWLISRVLAAVWYGVQGADPLTWFAVVAIVGVTSLSAAWRPSRRAMQVNPVTLLREE